VTHFLGRRRNRGWISFITTLRKNFFYNIFQIDSQAENQKPKTNEILAHFIEEEAKLTNLVASNYTLVDANLVPKYRKPFSCIAKGLVCSDWFPVTAGFSQPCTSFAGTSFPPSSTPTLL